MEEKEAREVLDIMMTADSDCCACARELSHLFVHSFPQFEEMAKEIFENYHLGVSFREDL